MRISDWSSDVCSSDLSTYQLVSMADVATALGVAPGNAPAQASLKPRFPVISARVETVPVKSPGDAADDPAIWANPDDPAASLIVATDKKAGLYLYRSEEHTSELQSLMRISYAVFCLKKKTYTTSNNHYKT